MILTWYPVLYARNLISLSVPSSSWPITFQPSGMLHSASHSPPMSLFKGIVPKLLTFHPNVSQGNKKQSMVAHTCNPSPQARGQQARGQPGLHKTLKRSLAAATVTQMRKNHSSFSPPITAVPITESHIMKETDAHQHQPSQVSSPIYSIVFLIQKVQKVINTGKILTKDLKFKDLCIIF